MTIISECAYEDFTLLKEEVNVVDYSTVCSSTECNFELPVFAYPSDTSDKYRNDITTSLMPYGNRYSNKEIYLEVLDCGTWSEVAQITDSTYGAYYTFTSQPDWIGALIEWHKVYTAEGEGKYRIKQKYTNIVTANIETRYSYTYDLRLYNDNFADKTTKIRYKKEGGKLGDKDNDKEMIDFKDIIWTKEIRFSKSFFGFESSEFTREFVRYKNGEQTWTQDEQVESLLFNVRSIPYSLHREFKTFILHSDVIEMSDYNESNPNPDKYNFKRVVCTSNYEPKWYRYENNAGVDLTFKPYYENLRSKRC